MPPAQVAHKSLQMLDSLAAVCRSLQAPCAYVGSFSPFIRVALNRKCTDQ